jgi:hypothetical protein
MAGFGSKGFTGCNPQNGGIGCHFWDMRRQIYAIPYCAFLLNVNEMSPNHLFSETRGLFFTTGEIGNRHASNPPGK